MAINYLHFREVYPIQVSCASIFQGISEVHPAKDQRKKKGDVTLAVMSQNHHFS